MKPIVFIDLEAHRNKKVGDIGVLKEDGSFCHNADIHSLSKYIKNSYFVCGQNIIMHDLKFLKI